MTALSKFSLPAVLLMIACKGNGESDVCPVDSVDITVNVNDTDGVPVTTAEVDIDGTACAGGNGVFTCTAIPGEPNQVTAVDFPVYLPATGRAQVDGPDCESAPAIELRMAPNQPGS
jgi:hypothetical protein